MGLWLTRIISWMMKDIITNMRDITTELLKYETEVLERDGVKSIASFSSKNKDQKRSHKQREEICA